MSDAEEEEQPSARQRTDAPMSEDEFFALDRLLRSEILSYQAVNDLPNFCKTGRRAALVVCGIGQVNTLSDPVAGRITHFVDNLRGDRVAEVIDDREIMYEIWQIYLARDYGISVVVDECSATGALERSIVAKSLADFVPRSLNNLQRLRYLRALYKKLRGAKSMGKSKIARSDAGPSIWYVADGFLIASDEFSLWIQPVVDYLGDAFTIVPEELRLEISIAERRQAFRRKSERKIVLLEGTTESFVASSMHSGVFWVKMQNPTCEGFVTTNDVDGARFVPFSIAEYTGNPNNQFAQLPRWRTDANDLSVVYLRSLPTIVRLNLETRAAALISVDEDVYRANVSKFSSSRLETFQGFGAAVYENNISSGSGVERTSKTGFAIFTNSFRQSVYANVRDGWRGETAVFVPNFGSTGKYLIVLFSVFQDTTTLLVISLDANDSIKFSFEYTIPQDKIGDKAFTRITGIGADTILLRSTSLYDWAQISLVFNFITGESRFVKSSVRYRNLWEGEVSPGLPLLIPRNIAAFPPDLLLGPSTFLVARVLPVETKELEAPLFTGPPIGNL